MNVYMQMIKYWLKAQKGQGLVEYSLILALVSIAAIVIMGTMGTSIIAEFQKVINAL